MVRNRYYDGPRSDHFDGVRFFNPGHPSTDRGIVDLLRWRIGGRRPHWPASIPAGQVRPTPRVAGLAVTMIGHASLLIQIGGLNLLVDPVWSLRASPLRWAGPRRVNPPGIAFDDLPAIDAVLLTHNHYDHLDLATLHRLWARHRPRLLAPLGNDRIVAGPAPELAVETCDWGGSWRVGDVRIWLHPANHWSARGLRDRRMALWGGFVIVAPSGTAYVAGDTGLGDGEIFRAVRARHGAPDVAILPIGAYAPRWFMRDQHTDPDDAVQALLACGAAQGLGVHWGTFALADEMPDEPAVALQQALVARGLPSAQFRALRPGDSWSRDHHPP